MKFWCPSLMFVYILLSVFCQWISLSFHLFWTFHKSPFRDWCCKIALISTMVHTGDCCVTVGLCLLYLSHDVCQNVCRTSKLLLHHQKNIQKCLKIFMLHSSCTTLSCATAIPPTCHCFANLYAILSQYSEIVIMPPQWFPKCGLRAPEVVSVRWAANKAEYCKCMSREKGFLLS